MILQLMFLSAFLLSYNIAMPLAGGDCPAPSEDDKMDSYKRFCDNYGAPRNHSFTFEQSDFIINADNAFLNPNDQDDKIQNLCFDQSATCYDGKLNYTLFPTTPEYAYCHWEYECKYDPYRIPFFLCEAKCQGSPCQCPPGYACEPILYSVPVLKADPCVHDEIDFTDTSIVWKWQPEAVAVACACKRAERACST